MFFLQMSAPCEAKSIIMSMSCLIRSITGWFSSISKVNFTLPAFVCCFHKSTSSRIKKWSIKLSYWLTIAFLNVSGCTDTTTIQNVLKIKWHQLFEVWSLCWFFVKLYILGWIIHPDIRGLKEKMNKKFTIYIAAVLIIVVIVSGAFIYTNYNAGSNKTGTQKHYRL